MRYHVSMEISTVKKGITYKVLVDNDFPVYKYGKAYLSEVSDLKYPVFCIKGKSVKISRIIMNHPKGMFVDHINGDTLDNRRINLRICNRSENMRNRRVNKNNKSRFKGVYPYYSWYKKKDGTRRKYFCAQIFINGKNKCLGYFDTKEEAAKKYNEVAKEVYGEYARLNSLT